MKTKTHYYKGCFAVLVTTCLFIFGSLSQKKQKQTKKKPTVITSQLLSYANQL